MTAPSINPSIIPVTLPVPAVDTTSSLASGEPEGSVDAPADGETSGEPEGSALIVGDADGDGKADGLDVFIASPIPPAHAASVTAKTAAMVISMAVFIKIRIFTSNNDRFQVLFTRPFMD